MKRLISVVLAMLIMLSCAAAPLAVYAKKDKLDQPAEFFVGVPDNKEKTLHLAWTGVSGADGYQIYRSNSGKSGTYQLIATTKNLAYTDNNLKQQTLYYYAVRAFAKTGGKTIYSDLYKDDCYTKISKNFAYKKLQQAYQISEQWIYCLEKYCNFKKTVTKKETHIDPDGSEWTYYAEYCLITNKSITTKQALKKYLSKYFDLWKVEAFVDAYYIEKGGRLYVRIPEWGDGGGQYRELAKVRDIVQRKNWITFSVLQTWNDFYGKYYDLQTFTLSRSGTNLVFSDDSWFPDAH